MGQILHRQILHSRATMTQTVRRAIQSSQASLRTLAQQYGINPKTVAKWKQRDHVQDAPMGPKEAHSTVLSTEEEARGCRLSQAHVAAPG